MSPHEHGRGPWFRHGRGGLFWLLPLILGVGSGALLFSGPRGPWLGYGPARWDQHERGAYGPGYREAQAPAAPQASAAPAAPQAEAGQPGREARHGGWEGRRHGPGRDHFSFFPFFGFRLALPLLLMAAGLWFLSGRRRPGGSGGPGGQHPQQQPPYTPPAPPASQTPEAQHDPPATGETQRL